MAIKMQILDNHIIYGYWSSEENYQFLVYYHPDGINCTVFIMDGADYGGGISHYFNSLSSTIDDIISSNQDKSPYEIKELIVNLPEAIATLSK